MTVIAKSPGHRFSVCGDSHTVTIKTMRAPTRLGASNLHKPTLISAMTAESPNADASARSQWIDLQTRRANAHRAFCAQAANTALQELLEMGVNARVFGSLIKEPELFREDSDIDFCIMHRSDIAMDKIEDVVRRHVGHAKYDLLEFDGLCPSVQKEVLVSGAIHVE